MSEKEHTIEEQVRLSKSLLWNLQQTYFEEEGIAAWSKSKVPHFITSNPFVANAYAQVVLGYCFDLISNGVELNTPVNIIELGGGSGRFAYHFIKRLQELMEAAALNIPFRYVYTDLSKKNVNFIKSHPYLEEFFEAGKLDVAQFDAVNDNAFHLEYSGEVIDANEKQLPTVVLANYFFDGIPQDLFYFKKGKILEGLITLKSKEKLMPPINAEALPAIDREFHYREIEGGYYDDLILEEVLKQYAQVIEDGCSLFPHEGIRCINRLKEMVGEQLLIITCDKGYNQLSDVKQAGEPSIVTHGSFSLMVNYHAITQHVINSNGIPLQTHHGSSNLAVNAYVYGINTCPHTRLAFKNAVDNYGPDDFYIVRKALMRNDQISGNELLAYLKMSCWDADFLMHCFSAAMEITQGVSIRESLELNYAFCKIWDYYLPIGEEKDLDFHLGMLYYTMNYYEEAILHFNFSLQWHGPTDSTMYNRGASHFCLGNDEKALEDINEALRINPQYGPAIELLKSIERGERALP